ncbi:MAG: hypothetical protein EOQ50_08180 [Mesorhizobium sp.]|uniref:DUF6894 family protein n=1 Tax=Mesorhizobium sp. TaxID=1871066 RepID=UPI000FE7CB9D|nr:hypothetical protein [Mesorhizobium sp.]RWB76899.1 MAG: hypothetical protein EOQ50_08180 [Mesorhizobium sp.]RWL81610.1 MAG: hypothetical protein EOR69_17270 [Mesorhizobium sp.]RWL89924.1 MAG: hypothetical protein EOR67_06255 [Mesorhizobium sp.]RWL98138.1 MAG: hypothetical protein EOR70_14935 [Mesorhizobium sp.]RWM04528.1 MAG: hypothetical protein EOR68_02635 [Mesorhizobium sp.]
MPLFYFDIHDGYEFTRDDTGIECSSLEDVSKQAVDVLPDIAREELPNGPRRTFQVKVRDGSGRHVFRASLTLASSWMVEEVNGEHPPGEDRRDAALSRTKTQVRALRREFSEDGLAPAMDDLDSLFSVAEGEVERLRKQNK